MNALASNNIVLQWQTKLVLFQSKIKKQKFKLEKAVYGMLTVNPILILFWWVKVLANELEIVSKAFKELVILLFLNSQPNPVVWWCSNIWYCHTEPHLMGATPDFDQEKLSVHNQAILCYTGENKMWS